MNEKLTSIREDLGKKGYSKEEEYFYHLNKELIESKRKELDRDRLEQERTDTKPIHWMKCPKCGDQMEELKISEIYADVCKGCQGIYFDQGELETLLEAKAPKSFFS